MAFFPKNPFIAPDIKDIIAEKRSAVRTLMLVFGAGIVLVSVLLGGYQIGQWILWKTAPQTTTPLQDPTAGPHVMTDADKIELMKQLAGTSTNRDFNKDKLLMQQLGAQAKGAPTTTREEQMKLMESLGAQK